MKILIVDDDLIVSRRIERILSQAGHRSQVVNSAAAARAALTASHWDAAIIDWQLPDGSGLDLIHEQRRDKSVRYLYVIMLTGMSGGEHRRQGMDAGADDFLLKPLDGEELMLRIRVALRITELQKQLAARNHELAQTKRRLEEDLLSAAKVQRDLLPSEDFSFPGVTIDWFLHSCDALGGDLVTLMPIDDRRLGFAVIDVVGHGAKAAILGVQISRRFRSGNSLSRFASTISHEVLCQPSQLAMLLNDEFPMDYRNLQFFTMCYGVLDTVSGHCRYVGCGHPPPVLINGSGQARWLPVQGHPIGVMAAEKVHFQEQSCQLQRGEALVLYSDGLPEAVNAQGELLGSPALLEAMAGDPQPEAILARLDQATGAWRGHDLLQDDCTVLAMRRL